MHTNWAVEHLQIIRTLMERVALYRRALAPVMFLTGIIGIVFSVCGIVLKIYNSPGFVIWWLTAGVLAFLLTLLKARQQALKDGEPFWSGPTKQVVNSLIPPLFIGVSLGVAAAINNEIISPPLLPIYWIMLYGVALCSAGFFMQRGMKLFGILFVIVGVSLLLILALLKIDTFKFPVAHWCIMGIFF